MMDNTMCNDEIDVAINRNSEINYPTCRPCHISLTRCDDVPRTSITTKIKSLEPKPKRLRIPVFNFIQKLNIRCIQYVVGGTSFWKVQTDLKFWGTTDPGPKKSPDPFVTSGPHYIRKGPNLDKSTEVLSSNDKYEICDICYQMEPVYHSIDINQLPKSFKEEDLLSNESLTCYSDDSDEIEIKVTDFTVIAECGHLCPLETIEKRNLGGYVSGYAIPIFEDDYSEDTPFIFRLPIHSPWIYHDGGEKILFGLYSNCFPKFQRNWEDKFNDPPSKFWAIHKPVHKKPLYFGNNC
uniref:Uncharacterized protein n=1 Tax=Romanomermis culicivorax TaxID=13658 RepID=A0A915L6K3_ROMCU